MATPSKFSAWVQAARPKTLPAAIAPVLVGSAYAWVDGKFHLLAAVCAGLGATLIQIATNFVNDYYDFKKGADTAERLGPARAVQKGWISPPAMKRAFIVTFLLVFVPGSYLIYHAGWILLLVGLVCMLAGYIYTGGPWPLAYSGLGDIFVLIFFGIVAVAGTYFVQAGSITYDVLWAGIAVGLPATAILVVNNLRDKATDAKAGKNTLVVRFGVTFARMEYTLCIIGAVAIGSYLLQLRTDLIWLSLAPILVLPLAVRPLQTVYSLHSTPELNPILGATARVLIVYSIIFSIALIATGTL